MGEIVLGQPRNDLPVLHIGSASYVDNEVAQLLPMPKNTFFDNHV